MPRPGDDQATGSAARRHGSLEASRSWKAARLPVFPASGPFWGELHTFLAVADRRSVTRAAEILGLGRATVSRQIRRLQDVLGHQLLVLTKHGAFLTQKGDELFRDLARIDREVLAATASLRAKGAHPEGDVRVGITDGLGFVFLLPKIEGFSREYPYVHLHLTRPLPFDAVRENKMDVVVGFEPELGPDILCEELGCVHFVPFAGRRYIAQHGVPSLDTLEKHHFITSRRFARTATWHAWHGLIARGQSTHSCDTSVTYGLMVKAGLGVGLLPSYVACEPSFVPVDFGLCIDIPLYAVVLRERLRSRPVRVAFEFVRSALQDTPWLARELTFDVCANGVPTGYDLLFNITEVGLPPV